MASEMSKDDSIELVQWVLFGAAGVLFAAGIGLGYKSEPASASVTLASGIFCLIFAFLTRFKRFKGLGIEAELWEQKQEEAARLIETLRSLSVVVAEQLLNLSVRMGRFDSWTTRKELFQLVDQLDQVLGDVDIPADQRDAMKTGLYRYTAIDMGLPIMEAIRKAVEEKEAEQSKVLEKFGSPVTDNERHNKASERLQEISNQKIDWDQINPLAPNIEFYDAFERTIAGADCLNAAERDALRASILEELADLHEWVTNRRLRRREQWLAGDND